MRALWLTSWYPTKISPYNGDFVKRHAEAASGFNDVHVICLVQDKEGSLTNHFRIEEFKNGSLSETIVYYYVKKSRLPFLRKILAAVKYRKLYLDAVKRYMHKNGRPDIIHVHVGMNAGIVARWIERNWKIPYVITEHWSGFLNESNDRFEGLPLYIRSAWKKVSRRARSISFVSDHLLKGCADKLVCNNPIVIPNVVDSSIFSPSELPPADSPVFIHVSGLDEWKNPIHILKAFKIVAESNPAVRLFIFGSKREDFDRMLTALGLNDQVSLSEEVPQTLLADYMKQSTALILYSSYETFGCVIIEANACGVPVIVSDIPVFHETVNEGINGYFVPLHQPELLASRMLEMIKNRSQFNSEAIAKETGSKYSYAVVGKQISDWYKEVLGK